MTTGVWPWVCRSCGLRYSAFRVYARYGPYYRDVSEWTVCAVCGPEVPARAEPPCGGWLDVWHTILRPVPEIFDPSTNPYLSVTKETNDTIHDD